LDVPEEVIVLDRPFIYVFDADTAGASGGTLTNGADYKNLTIPVNRDAPFLARRLAGRPLIGNQLQLYDRTSNYVSTDPFAVPPDYPLIPEMLFDPASQIRFDLIGVDAATASRAYGVPGSVNNYWTQLIFQGVKRFRDLQPYQTPYRYFDKVYSYPLDCSITYTGRLAPAYTAPSTPTRFSIEVRDFDFELYTISLQADLANAAIQQSDTFFKLMLFDQYANQLFSAPVLDSFLNYTGAVNNAVFPCPPLVYPVGSHIVFDVYSLLIAAQVTATLTVTFTGVQRIAC
jgi:hypothetical protein